MRLLPKDKKALLKAALGQIPADLAIVNAKVFNVFTGEILPAIVYVYDGFIAHVEYDDVDHVEDAKQIYDAQGQYLVPGLLDAHVHIESSMLTPVNFAKVVLPKGTTTVITDPHEIGNVFGARGIRYMHDCGMDVHMRQFIDVPSCVPSVPGLENTGADLDYSIIEELAQLPNVIGLAEVMDYLAVINGDERMMKILEVFEKNGLYIQGHAPFLSGRNLSAYLCGGPRTCHETRDTQEAINKYRAGMHIDMRDSSICRNVKEIFAGLKDFRYFDTLSICTDDRESDDLMSVGGINDVVRAAIKNGMDPRDAIKSATINTAREIHLENLGAIAPGYVADMITLPSLEDMKPSAVFTNGKLVAQDDKLIVEIANKEFAIEQENSVNFKELTIEDFKIKAEGESCMVNVMAYDGKELSTTHLSVEELKVKDGYIDISDDPDLKYILVINRHGLDNKALRIVRDFGTTCGAVASTISHDAHNLTVVFDKPEDALIVVNQLKAVGGGMAASKDGKLLHCLPLPIGGLLSQKTAEELNDDVVKMKAALCSVGLDYMVNPLMRIVTAALPVVPDVKMSDLGLVDVNKKVIIPTFAE